VSNWVSGLALRVCWEHERAAELRGTARLTLAAMGSFARDRDNPRMCIASHDAIATRAGLSVRAVISAQERLAKLGAIERDGRSGAGLAFTVRWRLTWLSAPRAEEGMQELQKRALHEVQTIPRSPPDFGGRTEEDQALPRRGPG